MYIKMIAEVEIIELVPDGLEYFFADRGESLVSEAIKEHISEHGSVSVKSFKMDGMSLTNRS